MTFFTRRLPARQELFHTFVTCSFPLFLWTFFRLFDLIPSWAIKLSIWEVISIIAYTLAYTLIESLLLWLFFVLVAGLLPAAYLRDRLVIHSTVIVWVSAIWAVVIHINAQGVYAWGTGVVSWVPAYLLSLLAAEFVLWKVKIFGVWVERLVSQISILASAYIFTGLAGLLIAFLRNY